jgi:hypothetical protein
MPYGELPLESSVSALKQFTLPKGLLNLVLLLFIIGFGMYLLYAWLYHVESSGGHDDFRNIFISFIITVGLLAMYQLCLSIAYLGDSWKREKDFGLDESTSFAKPDSRKQLEEWLAALQGMQELEFDEGEDYPKLEDTVAKLKSSWEEKKKSP